MFCKAFGEKDILIRFTCNPIRWVAEEWCSAKPSRLPRVTLVTKWLTEEPSSPVGTYILTLLIHDETPVGPESVKVCPGGDGLPLPHPHTHQTPPAAPMVRALPTLSSMGLSHSCDHGRSLAQESDWEESVRGCVWYVGVFFPSSCLMWFESELVLEETSHSGPASCHTV